MKRCQVCQQDFDPADESAWHCARAIHNRHVPTDKGGVVYVLHFDEPTFVRQADNGHVQPTTHYVGWTSQPVKRRVAQHGVSEDSIVSTQFGTAKDDEKRIKAKEQCPHCGASLAAECLGNGPPTRTKDTRGWLEGMRANPELQKIVAQKLGDEWNEGWLDTIAERVAQRRRHRRDSNS